MWNNHMLCNLRILSLLEKKIWATRWHYWRKFCLLTEFSFNNIKWTLRSMENKLLWTIIIELWAHTKFKIINSIKSIRNNSLWNKTFQKKVKGIISRITKLSLFHSKLLWYEPRNHTAIDEKCNCQYVAICQYFNCQMQLPKMQYANKHWRGRRETKEKKKREKMCVFHQAHVVVAYCHREWILYKKKVNGMAIFSLVLQQ